nr:zinc finger, CCHC-type [Tanacetum cinerariifolium]
MGFNESRKYKKTFIGSGVGTGSVQTLLEGHSILSLEGSLSRVCDVKKNGSLKAHLQHMKALSTIEAGYMTFTKAWKKEIWLKGLLTESGYELSLVAGIATGA